MTETIRESFEWMAPEFRVVDAGKHTIKIKGVAMKSNVVSRNQRKYVDEELKKAARTWIGKPVTINHDMNRKVGDVKWMEYEGGALEYLADIKKEPYVSMLRDGSTKIRGVSIEANYLHNRCPHCQERFYTEEDFHQHMHVVHFVKTDPAKEVHGMYGTALSLVLSPEEPGYPGTTIDLMEMYEKPVLQLLETVITIEKERKDYLKTTKGKAALTPVTRYAANPAIREQDETPSPPCPDGWHEADGKCVKDTPPPETSEQEGTVKATPPQDIPADQPTPPCPSGYHEVEGKCVKDTGPEVVDPVSAPVAHEQAEGNVVAPEGCPPGFHLEGNACIADPEPVETPSIAQADKTPVPPPESFIAVTEQDEEPCPEGQHRNADGKCVPDEPVAAETVPLTLQAFSDIPLPALLNLGEPCSPELKKCVDALIADGKPEDSAWAICRSRVGETAPKIPDNVYDAQKHILRVVDEQRIDLFSQDKRIAEAVNTQNKAIAAVIHYVKNLHPSSQSVVDVSNRNFTQAREDARRIHMELGKMHTTKKTMQESLDKTAVGLNALRGFVKTRDEYMVKKLSELATAIANRPKDDITWKAELIKLNERFNQTKKDFEGLLDKADESVKTLEERLKESEDARIKAESEAKEANKVKETAETDLKTRIDNLEDRLRPTFQGKQLASKETATSEYPVDPLKESPKSRKA